LIEGSQAVYCNEFKQSDQPIRRAQGNIIFIGASPRFIMEAMGMLLIIILAYILVKQEDGISKAIPILGALALGAQRILPILQQIYNSWSNIQGNKSSLRDTLELLDQPFPKYINSDCEDAMRFCDEINLKKIWFRYSDNTEWVIKNLNLTIKKGSTVGIIGKTGSGKSTLIDIIMNLLEPTKGVIEIDGNEINEVNYRLWQKNIAHVPQTIYLSDNSVEENIAFGVKAENIDYERVRESARRAKIDEKIEALPNKYKTLIGERGVRLSGGQRQRIGIARALYKRASVIIFDEATSSLDTETEGDVMNSITNLDGNLTMIIIVHRITTLKNCSYIIEINNGEVKRSDIYKNMELN